MKRFTALYDSLSKAYKVIRYAKKDIENVENRTKTIIKLWRFFQKTMNKVFKIDEFSVDLKEYRNLDRDLNRQAREIIRKIRSILDVLHPLLTDKPVSVLEELYAKFKWFIRNQEDIRLLYVDMELLTGYMRVFIHLVQLQISIQQYKLNRSAATKVQIDTMEKMVKTELREIRRIQQTHQFVLSHEHPVMDSRGKKELLHEVRKILQQELSRLPRRNNGNDSTSDSHPPSSPPPASTSTPSTSPPSSPEGPDKGHGLAQVPSQESEPEPLYEPNGLRELSKDNPSGQQPIPFFLHSEASYVSVQEPISPMQPNISNTSLSPIVEEGIGGGRGG